jgi:hypothetical protein
MHCLGKHGLSLYPVPNHDLILSGLRLRIRQTADQLWNSVDDRITKFARLPICEEQTVSAVGSHPVTVPEYVPDI